MFRRWSGPLVRLLNYLLIPWVVWQGTRLAQKEKLEAIFTVPWDHFTIAAYFMHRITGLPVFTYVMDDPVGALTNWGLQSLVYSLFMSRFLRRCKQIWGVSDGMCEHLEKTFGVACLPLLPLVDLEDFQCASVGRSGPSGGAFHIVYTGSIYSAQVDAVRRLVHILNQQPELGAADSVPMILTFYTSAPAGVLERQRLMGKNIRRDAVRHEDIAKVVAQADLAFLPLSFDPGMRHVVETSFPSKIAEYLAAGVPILVHAPRYSTVSRYCRQHDCGFVVDEPSEDSLRDALKRLAADPWLRQKLAVRAREIAKQNHDAKQITRLFLEKLCCGS